MGWPIARCLQLGVCGVLWWGVVGCGGPVYFSNAFRPGVHFAVFWLETTFFSSTSINICESVKIWHGPDKDSVRVAFAHLNLLPSCFPSPDISLCQNWYDPLQGNQVPNPEKRPKKIPYLLTVTHRSRIIIYERKHMKFRASSISKVWLMIWKRL